jgi:hypothetical protein
MMRKNKEANALRFGKTASGTVSLSQSKPKPKLADEKRLKEKEETKIDHVRLNVVEKQ